MLNTRMVSADGDPVVTRVNHPEHYATETSMVPRIQLPWVSDGAVRNHAVVATTTSASLIDRQRSWKMLTIMAAAGNEDAETTLKALEGFVIE
jgi:hypothetical protein